MATFATLAETNTTSSTDEVLLNQGGINYKQNREVLAAGISNSRWTGVVDYLKGSETTGSDGIRYKAIVANGVSSTVQDPTTDTALDYWVPLSIVVENRLKGNQVPVVEGSTGDPLPSAVATTYAINSEPVAGYEFVTAATNVTFDAGLWKGTGQLQRKYKRDAAGFISKSSEYAGVRLHDDTQLRALVDDIATNGCSVTDDVDYVYVTFELSDFPSGVKFPFISAEVGTIAEIGDFESYQEQTGLVDFSYSSSVNYEIYKSGKIRMWGLHPDGTAGATTITFPISFPNEITYANAILSGAIPVTELNSPHIVSTTASSMVVGRVYVQNGGTVAQATQLVYWEAEGY